jgi:UDP-2-acetamido-2,6-beta-L-arabino-hexul-4-ose reductase
MRVLITGANGFLGSNLCQHLRERPEADVIPLTRDTAPAGLQRAVQAANFIFHLAGANRVTEESELTAGNVELTRDLCREAAATGRRIPIVFTSSTQVDRDNAYGRSKRAAEEVLLDWHVKTRSPLRIFRLPNVFGKWCRPNYNSVVATFCHNLARDLPIRIDDPDAGLTLVYVDDVIESLIAALEAWAVGGPYHEVSRKYALSVGELAEMIRAFKAGRDSLLTERVGVGLGRSLYATYMSHLPPSRFSYPLPVHEDQRGKFVEALKTTDSGQFSFFTALPGVTRGGHYHHSKSEKFLVLKGQARFRFRHIVSGETNEIRTTGDRPEAVDTIPGWAHDITNVGNEEMIVMLWANEVFDRDKTDTYACAV